MKCNKCKKQVHLEDNKVKFRSTCDNCGADLHSCINCKYYQVGKPNDCLVPNTEYISDREKYNFCDEFSYKEIGENSRNINTKDIEKKLFKDSDDKEPPSSFDNLFK